MSTADTGPSVRRPPRRVSHLVSVALRWVEPEDNPAGVVYGTIAVGADADLVVWDGEKKHVLSDKTLHMKVDYTPYEGREVTGAATHVLSRGKVVVQEGKYVGRKGDGRFVKRGRFGV